MEIAGPAAEGMAKLLNKRDFQALSGFPSPRIRATIRRRQMGKSNRPGLFPPAWLFMPKRAIGWAKFRAYMVQTHP
jgi:hypothetical protein